LHKKHWSTKKDGRFPFQRNVCNQTTNINPNNLVERQSIHLRGKEIDELCGVRRTRGEGELVYHNLQQPL